METLLQDLRYAARMLLRTPGFAAVAVLTLALGIGINTTIFSVVNAILIRPLPHVDTERLVALREESLRDGQGGSVSPANLADWQAQSASFQDIAAYHDRQVVMRAGRGDPERIEAEAVTVNLFPLLGARPALGRLFLPEEAEPGRNRVVLLSDHMWRNRFEADPQILGKTVQLNGVAHTVVGVMGPRFGFPDNQPLWVPIVPSALADQRGERYLRVVGRLRPGVTLEQARAEMGALARRLEEQHPETNAGMGVRLIDFDEAWVGEIRPALLVMLAAVGMVLLIACANVAGLFLARAAARRKEIAVRVALGAGRGRLVRQLLTESSLVALMGGALGVLLAHWGLALILASFPFQPPLWMVFDIDANVLLFTLLLSLGTGVLFGLAPALRATRPDLQDTLKDGGRGSTAGARQGRMQGALVVAELALAMVLLVGAMLMVRSFLRLQGVDPGFDTAQVLTLRLVTGGDRYAEPAARMELYRQVVERVKALPGVEGAGTVSFLPLSGMSVTSGLSVEGVDLPADQRPAAEVRGISPDYFRVLRVPLLRGRSLTPEEADGDRPVVVVNRALAERFWPGEDAVGRRVRVGGPWLTVVGVAEDVRMGGLDEKPTAQVYVPYSAEARGYASLLVRTHGDPAAATAAVRRAVHAVDPSVVVDEAFTMREVVHRSLWQRRLFGGLFTSFAAIALLLAVSGVYAVIAYSVSQRTHEFGVRMALGARPGRILGMVVRQGAVLTVIGVGIGALGAFAVTRVMGSLLYGVAPTDPVTFAAVTVILASATVLASWIPARRATRVDPMIAIRAE
ncbi:MAG TPA: ABC transporter permease [Longimicrobiaceae bacterium]|nr:ABC transporter permease [Longimicrobiaceae bacterium]